MDYPYGDQSFSTTASETGDEPGPAMPRSEAAPDGDSVVAQARLLHTPSQAARLLSVRESWLRRMAGRREIACTLVGKHLRFSDADLRSIIQRGSRPAHREGTSRREAPGPYPRRQRQG